MDRLRENGRSGFALAGELTIEFKLTVTVMVAVTINKGRPRPWFQG
jgi:hypothetical protein